MTTETAIEISASINKKRFPFLTLLQAICIGALLFGLVDQSDAYLLILRFLACAAAGYTAYAGWQNRSIGWLGIFLGIILLYNPLVPLVLSGDGRLLEYIATAILFLCESNGTKNFSELFNQSKLRLMILFCIAVFAFMAYIYCILFALSVVAIVYGVIGDLRGPHLHEEIRVVCILGGLLFASGFILIGVNSVKTIWMATIEEITGENSSSTEKNNLTSLEWQKFRINWTYVIVPNIVGCMILTALAGLIVLCFKHDIFVLLPEGLLLTTVGLIVFRWWSRYTSERGGPAILRSPINQILIFVSSIAAITSGLPMIWLTSSPLAYAIVLILFAWYCYEAYLKSETRIIRDIINVYKMAKQMQPNKDERFILALVNDTMLSLWEVKSRSTSSSPQDFAGKSICNVVANLLINRDVYTGTHYMRTCIFGIDITYNLVSMGWRWKKEEKRERLIDKLLEQPMPHSVKVLVNR